LIRIAGKGLIKIVYDADGNKLQKIFTSELDLYPAPLPITTTYINGFVYKDEKLQFISFEEGRLRIVQNVNSNNNFDYLQIAGTETMLDSKKGTFDFFIRDYQSNVRMVLTEETHKGSNVCTMEQDRAANEEPIFGKTDAMGNPIAGNEVKARFSISSIPGQNFGQGWTNPTIGRHVSRLQNFLKGSVKVGPNSLLKVMAGDKVSATTIYYYQRPVDNNIPSIPILNNILNSLTSAISTSFVTSDLTHGAASNITSNLGSNIPFTNATSPDANNTFGRNPKAYLTVLFFDERFNFVGEGSTTRRVEGAGNDQRPLVIDNVQAPKNGYAYIYISNESQEPVYFDNLRVVHERGRITEENHYYAYGLKIAGISSTKAGDVNEGELKNRRQYQGAFSEYDEDIQWNDFALRNYDPQIARWVQQDPYQQFASPYVALGGDPVNMVDPSGGWSALANGLAKGLGMTRLGVAALTTFAGALLGNAAYGAAGGEGAKGLIVGAFLGLASNFGGSGAWSIGLKIGTELGVQGGTLKANELVDKELQVNVERQVPRGGPNRGNSSIDNDENNSGPGDLFTSLDAAAIGFYSSYRKVLQGKGVEYSAILYSIVGEDKKTYYGYTVPERLDDDDDARRASPGLGSTKFDLPRGGKEITTIHYHGSSDSWDPNNPGNEDFSGPDRQNHKDWKVDNAYLITPSLDLKVYRSESNGPGILLAFPESGTTKVVQNAFEYPNGNTYKSLNELKPVNVKPKFIKPADPKTYLFPFR
jgi:RHS repeat-associated protein